MKRAALIACLAACGQSSSHLTDARGIDARDVDAPSADGPPVARAVRVDTFVIPEFIAYRNGSGGAWQTPAQLDGTAAYEVEVVDDYLVVMVCDNAGSGSAFDAEEYGFTVSGDGLEVQAGCTEPGTGSAALTTITGSMKQAGSVQIGGLGSAATTAPWTYAVTTTSGVHDVLAIDTANRAVFDKALTFAGSATGPAIDTTDGAPLASQTLTVTGLDSSELSVEDDLVSQTDFAVVFQGSAATVLSMPLSELVAGDFQIPLVSAFDAAAFRYTQAVVDATTAPPTSFALLPRFSTATFDGVTTAWTALPVATFTTLVNNVTNADSTQVQDLTVSSSWVAARQATSLTFDASAPGYLWVIDPTSAEPAIEEEVSDQTTEITAGTVAFPAGPATNARAHRVAAARVRARARQRLAD